MKLKHLLSRWPVLPGYRRRWQPAVYSPKTCSHHSLLQLTRHLSSGGEAAPPVSRGIHWGSDAIASTHRAAVGPSQLTPRFPDQWIKWVSSTCLEAQKSQSSHNPSRRSTARGLFVCSSCCFSSFRPDWFWKRDLIISTTFGSADKLFFFVPCWCAADVMDVCNVVLLCCPVTPCSSCCVFNCFLLTVFTLQIRMTSIIYWKYLFYVPRWPTTR